MALCATCLSPPFKTKWTTHTTRRGARCQAPVRLAPSVYFLWRTSPPVEAGDPRRRGGISCWSVSADSSWGAWWRPGGLGSSGRPPSGVKIVRSSSAATTATAATSPPRRAPDIYGMELKDGRGLTHRESSLGKEATKISKSALELGRYAKRTCIQNA